MDVSVAPPPPFGGSLHMYHASTEFVLYHVGEPKSGYANRPEALNEQLRGLLSDSLQREHKSGANYARL